MHEPVPCRRSVHGTMRFIYIGLFVRMDTKMINYSWIILEFRNNSWNFQSIFKTNLRIVLFFFFYLKFISGQRKITCMWLVWFFKCSTKIKFKLKNQILCHWCQEVINKTVHNLLSQRHLTHPFPKLSLC